MTEKERKLKEQLAKQQDKLEDRTSDKYQDKKSGRNVNGVLEKKIDKVEDVKKDTSLGLKVSRKKSAIVNKLVNKKVKKSRKKLLDGVEEDLSGNLDHLDDVFDELGMPEGKSKIYFAVDISGSMDYEYRSGKVQEFLKKLMALSLKLDEEREINFWLYSSEFSKLENVTENNYSTYIDDVVLKTTSMQIFWGTNTNEVSIDIESKIKKDKKNGIHPLVIYLMDDDINFNLLSDIADRNKECFFKFMSLESSSNNISIERLSSKDNVDYIFNITNEYRNEEYIYELMLRKYDEWMMEKVVSENLEQVSVLKEFVLNINSQDFPDKKELLENSYRNIIGNSILSDEDKLDLKSKVYQIYKKKMSGVSKLDFIKMKGSYSNETKELESKKTSYGNKIYSNEASKHEYRSNELR